MDQEHSPEPWKTSGILPDRGGKNHAEIDGIFDADGCLVADAVIGRDYSENADLIAAGDMRRICACVNACKNIPNEVLGAGVVRLAVFGPLDAIHLDDCTPHTRTFCKEGIVENACKVAALLRAAGVTWEENC